MGFSSLLYRKIAAHPPPSSILSQKLIAEGTITAAESDAIKAEYNAALEEALAKARKKPVGRRPRGGASASRSWRGS